MASRAALADHAVFDLVANRTLAHTLSQNGLVISAGAPGFAKYTHFGRPLTTWKLRATVDGKKVALPRTQATLLVPLTAAESRSGSLTLRIKSPSRQTVRASARGKSSPAMLLENGWQTVELALPAGALAAGENKILLHFLSGGVAVETIDVGQGASTAATISSSGIDLPASTGVAYYVEIPEGSSLRVQGNLGGCQLWAHAERHDGAAFHEQVLIDHPLSLASLGRQVVRLELRADRQGTVYCRGVHLSAAALTLSGDAVQPQRTQRPRNILFWMTDDTRSDRYRIYNPKTRVETPVMDALAKTSTVFRTAYVQGNESRVSHASLWTGLYPAQHHFIAEKAKLDPKFISLAEVVKPSGRRTVGLMGNGFIDEFWGFGRGWDILRNHIHQGGGLLASDFVKAAQNYLQAHPVDPFFLYLGTIDVHVSWRAHQPWLNKYDPQPYNGPFLKACLDPQLDNIVLGRLHVSERDKARIVALYDCDVSYNDAMLGKLLAELERRGLQNDTMVIVTADHGEELWDHGRIGHGQSLREELVHVPLLIHYPPLFPARAVEEGVEIIDLLPTIADVLGVKIPAAVQGESLLPLAQGLGAGYARPAIGSQYELAHSMRLSHYKLWVGGSGDTRFFDVANDAAEAHELSTERPIERRFVTDALSLWMAYQSRWKKSRWGVASNQTSQFASDLESEKW